ncbi:hypothetical protein VP01_3266g2, partial [Puccinia sorghi]
MDGVNPTILKTTIEAIPTLTEENFSSWRTRITALFKIGGFKDQILDGKPEIEEDDNTTLCAVILSKLSNTTQSNVVTPENEDNAQIIWKAILKHFMLSEPSNWAQVYNQSANIKFDISNIKKFMTDIRSVILKMEDVGIKLEDCDLRPSSSSLDNIKQSITHSWNVLVNQTAFLKKKEESQDDEVLLEGHYHNNLPILEFEPVKLQSHLSSAEMLHKSLGH